ncbi:MAG: cold-shock protein [Chloroflexia bacterium]|nr:cold-shock protein [Chloroflexia bacterium]
MPVGTVKVFSPRRGSGFIVPDSGGDRVYVHKSGISAEGDTPGMRLEAGQRVEFSIGQRPKGPAAVNVRPAPAGSLSPRDAAALAARESAAAGEGGESSSTGA